MDRKTWMYGLQRASDEYLHNLKYFLKVANDHRENKGERYIWCPCKCCQNCRKFVDSDIIEEHLICDGFMNGYTRWSQHAELFINSNTIYTGHTEDYIDDSDNDDNLDSMLHDIEDDIPEEGYEKFQQMFEDAEKPLYVGCTKFTKLSAVLKLFNLKANNGWSDKSCTALLEILHEMLPESNELPVSLYQAKKLMCAMDLEIERIHACPNDCMLYRNEYADLHECIICGTSRYIQKQQTKEKGGVKKKGPPAKLLWYFPIIPRLKRLFANDKDAKLLRWHSDERKKDGKLRHVVDSPQWGNIDSEFEEFGKENRNIRFGLSSDGINPFRTMNHHHSTWPVLLCIYNLPPWLCMKRKYIMMSLLIQGPKQPGNDIDVFLAPLIDDMKELWNSGVEVYDAYMKEYFQLHAMIFCTISDFPAYANLSGYSTKGKKACPVCEDDTRSLWLNWLVIDPEVLDSWQRDIITTLCQLEMYFPPSFFDVMVHLVSHIVREIKACGPVFLWYMYPFKRYMGILKGYVRNQYRPDASIVRGYAAEEVIEFCTNYLKGVATIGIPLSRHKGRLQGVGTIGLKVIIPDRDEFHLAHFTVLQHMTCVAPYVNKHMEMLHSKNKGKTEKWLVNEHIKTFPQWFKGKVKASLGRENVDRLVQVLGFGPQYAMSTYQSYDINGYTFYTQNQDTNSTLQNSGVTLIAMSRKYSSENHEGRSIIAKDSYYGVIQEI